MRLRPNAGSMPGRVIHAKSILPALQMYKCSSSLTATILKTELTTPSELQPPTHPPTAILKRVKAGHLHVHENNSGLLSAFLRLRLIYKSARTVSDLHISQYLWTLSAFVSAHILGHFTVHMLADHKHVQSTTTCIIYSARMVSQSGWLG